MSAFYDQASLVVVPSGYKSGKIYAQKPLTTDGQLTFTRASTATRVNASGLIETVASGVPRLDYTNSSCPKLLLEPQRTNALTYSEQIGGTGWTSDPTDGTITVTANYAAAPDGTNTADRLQIVRGTNYSQLYQPVSVTIGQSYTVSVYLKSLSGTPTISTIYTTNATGKQTLTSNWARYTFTFTAPGTTVFPMVALYGADSATCDILAWGFQFEAGAYATSYVKTEAAAVTRLGDDLSATNLQSGSLIGATAGTFFVETNKTDDAIWFNQRIFLTSTTVRAFLIDITGGQIRLRVWDASSVGPTITTSGLTNGTVKYLIKWDGTTVKVFANGSLVGSGSAPSYAYTTYTAYESTGFSNNEIKQLLFFTSALSDDKCIELTTL